MRAAEILKEAIDFDQFIGYMFDLYNNLAQQTNRQYVIDECRRAIERLQNYPAADDSQKLLIEVAIESFTELLQQAGGTP
jgi:hypothetical protein